MRKKSNWKMSGARPKPWLRHELHQLPQQFETWAWSFQILKPETLKPDALPHFGAISAAAHVLEAQEDSAKEAKDKAPRCKRWSLRHVRLI